MHRLNGRLARVEAHSLPTTQRIWHVYPRKGEDSGEAIARQGIEPGPWDIVVFHRYGRQAGPQGEESPPDREDIEA